VQSRNNVSSGDGLPITVHTFRAAGVGTGDSCRFTGNG
jgi:hypothetical protein